MEPDARAGELAELVEMEVADIVATTNGQGFLASETLEALRRAVEAATAGLAKDPDPTQIKHLKSAVV